MCIWKPKSIPSVLAKDEATACSQTSGQISGPLVGGLGVCGGDGVCMVVMRCAGKRFALEPAGSGKKLARRVDMPLSGRTFCLCVPAPASL